MKRLTPIEMAYERQWRLKAYALQCLPSYQIGEILRSPMLPTLGELRELGRQRAEIAGKCCAFCGKPLPIERATKAKKRKKWKVLPATKGA